MIDATTLQPLRVSTDRAARPYIRLPLSQLEGVRQLLDEHSIAYSVDTYAISLDGAPEVTYIDLGRDGDASRVQRILDCAA
jgi:hypothetical protein